MTFLPAGRRRTPSCRRRNPPSDDRSPFGGAVRCESPVDRRIRSLASLVGSPRRREVAVRTVRGITVAALATLTVVALVGILGIAVSTVVQPRRSLRHGRRRRASRRWPTSTRVSCAPTVSPSSATCVAVGDDGGHVASVIVSQNGGVTWSDATPPPGVTTLSTVSCPSAAVCYAGGGSGIMKSSNGGASWTVQDPSFPAQSISCFTIDECTAVGGNGITRTTNGSTWNPQTAPPDSTLSPACLVPMPSRVLPSESR